MSRYGNRRFNWKLSSFHKKHTQFLHPVNKMHRNTPADRFQVILNRYTAAHFVLLDFLEGTNHWNFPQFTYHFYSSKTQSVHASMQARTSLRHRIAAAMFSQRGFRLFYQAKYSYQIRDLLFFYDDEISRRLEDVKFSSKIFVFLFSKMSWLLIFHPFLELDTVYTFNHLLIATPLLSAGA